MAATRKGRLLRLTWLDEYGEAYRTQDLPPTVAKELLKRSGVYWIDFPGRSYGHPLHHLSRRAVAESRQGVTGKKGSLPGSKTVVTITLPEDNPEQEPNND